MQYGNKKRAVIFGIGALGMLGLLFYFSGQSAQESSEVSGGLVEALLSWLVALGMDAGLLEHLLRKTAHAGLFAVLGFMTGMSLLSCMEKRRALAAGLSLCALTAVANELHQLTAAERSCEITDMLLDTAGAAVGVTAAALTLFLIYQRQNNRR